MPSLRSPSELQGRYAELEALSGAKGLAVAISDFETGRDFTYHGDRWFHAASTIKLAVLLGVYGAIHRGDLLPQSRVHVRNRFLSCSVPCSRLRRSRLAERWCCRHALEVGAHRRRADRAVHHLYDW